MNDMEWRGRYKSTREGENCDDPAVVTPMNGTFLRGRGRGSVRCPALPPS